MRNLNRGILFILLLVCSSFVSHKFYVSHFQLDYGKADKTLQLTVKVFSDDLETALKAEGSAIKITKKLKDAETQKIHTYLNKKLKISADKTEQNLSWVGYEIESDIIWLYLESKPLVSSPHKININCSFLTEEFEGQANLFNIKIGTQTKSEYLSRNNTQFEASFE